MYIEHNISLNINELNQFIFIYTLGTIQCLKLFTNVNIFSENCKKIFKTDVETMRKKRVFLSVTTTNGLNF